jgi:prepilin-type N-terminal cleavage/methylation domain-containing protein
MKKFSNKNGLTMMEVIIVLIIIGGMIALAVPRYTDYLRRIRSQEAVQVLTAVWGAQREFFRRNGFYFSGAHTGVGSINDTLNITIPFPLKNFTNLRAEGPAGIALTCTAIPAVARTRANDASYVINVLADGSFRCTNTANVCPTTICRHMGY